MLIYIITALLLVLFAILSDIKYFRDKKIFQFIFMMCGCGQLFYISAFRLNTGKDYAPYARTFIELLGKSTTDVSNERMEKGYLMINKYIQIFTNRFQALFIVTSLIIIVFVGAMLYKHCPNPSLGLLMFYFLGFYFNSMNFIRNMFAACIILFAYKYIRDKKFIQFTVIVLLASAFHLSALLILPFYFILNIKFNNITLALYSAAGILIFCFSNNIMSIFTKYIYVSYPPETSLQMFGGIPSAYSLFVFVIFICAFLLRKDIESESKWGTILISAAFFDLYFSFIGIKHSILSRFSLYFGPIAALILIPFIIRMTVSKLKNKTDIKMVYKIRTYFCLIGTSVSSLAFFIYALYNNYNSVIPHDWIWNLR